MLGTYVRGFETCPATASPIQLVLRVSKVDFGRKFGPKGKFDHMDGAVALVDSHNRLGGVCIYVGPATGCHTAGMGSLVG